MTLAIVTHVPEGIIMASDSRQSISIDQKTPEGVDLPKVETVNSDNVYKTSLLSRKHPHASIPLFEVGVTSFGQDLLGNVPMASHIKKFFEAELTDSDDVTTIPKKLVDYFRKSFPDADTGFHIAGYKKDGKISTPYVFYCHVAKNIFDQRRNIAPDGSLIYGATWSGQIDVLNSIIQPSLQPGPEGKTLTVPKPPIVFGGMPLQDAIDFSAFAIRITIETIRFQARPKNVGGPIDILALTPDGATWIQRKELRFT
jgi:hypothetical protein